VQQRQKVPTLIIPLPQNQQFPDCTKAQIVFSMKSKDKSQIRREAGKESYGFLLKITGLINWKKLGDVVCFIE
jgi:hypothetical protein